MAALRHTVVVAVAYGLAMSYRALASRPVLTWSVVVIAARVPVAMAPLAVVFLVRERPGGYGLGALLAAVYVLGEVAGAALLGPRLKAERARKQHAAGLAMGAAAFAGLGLLPEAHPLLLGVLATFAGAAPAAATGGLRMLLQSQLSEEQMAAGVSYEAMINSVVWSVAPALTAVLALRAAAYAPQLLAAGLMLAAAGGLWALPRGWETDDADREGASMLRILARSWPVFVTASAAMTLLALAELVLPALLEQRGIGVGWSGPLLTAFAVSSAVGAFVYGVRGWPGRIRTQGLVLLLAGIVSAAAMGVMPGLVGIAVALMLAGLFLAGVQVTRNLRLRETLPPSTLAAGYSVMYAAGGAGYATSAALTGLMLAVTTPAVAVLAGAGLTLVLVAVSEVGERRPASDRGPCPEGAPVRAG